MSNVRVTTKGVHKIGEVEEELGTGGPGTAPEEVKKAVMTVC